MNVHKPALLELERTSARSPLEELLAGPIPMPDLSSSATGLAAAPVVSKIVAFSDRPLVDFPGNPSREPIAARHTCAITAGDIGRDAVLVFEQNDYLRPIIIGLLQPPASGQAFSQPVAVSLDGEQLTLTAKNEIVLRCGKASITLPRAGKVLIRGAYLLNRSSGVNRIKGGSVQIN